jgi:hypothetical protein
MFVAKVLPKLVQQGAANANSIIFDWENAAIGFDLMLGAILTTISEAPNQQGSQMSLLLWAMGGKLLRI